MAIANTLQLRQSLMMLTGSGYRSRLDFFRQYVPAFEGFYDYRLEGGHFYCSFYAERSPGVFKKLEETEVTAYKIPFESCEDGQREYIAGIVDNALISLCVEEKEN